MRSRFLLASTVVLTILVLTHPALTWAAGSFVTEANPASATALVLPTQHDESESKLGSCIQQTPRILGCAIFPSDSVFADRSSPSQNMLSLPSPTQTNPNFATRPLVLMVKDVPNPVLQDIAFLKFDMTSVLPHAILASHARPLNASLWLFAEYVSAFNNASVRAYHVPSNGWGENTLTWNNMPAIDTSHYDVNLIHGTNRWYQWNVTSDVISDIQSDGVSSFALMAGFTSWMNDAWFSRAYEANMTISPELNLYFVNREPTLTLSTSLQVTLSQSQVNPGQQVVVSASVSPAPTGGTLSLSVSESGGQYSTQWRAVLNSAQASPGTASVSWSPPGPGTYNFKATFSGYTDTAANKIYSQSESVPTSITVQLMQTTLTLSASPTSTDIDALTGSTGTITITGTLSPQVAGASVLLSYSTPSGNSFKPVVVGPGGIFGDSLTPTKPGIYTISAQYQGDQTHQPTTSQSVVVTVGQNWMTAIAIGAVVAAAIIIVAVVFLRRRRTR